MKKLLLILLCLPLINLAQQTYIPDNNLGRDTENVVTNSANSSYSSPFIGLVLEEVNNSSGTFTGGEVTYQLYAELNSSSAKLLQMYGDETRPHLIATTTTFYQDVMSAANLQQDVNTLFLAPPYNTMAGFENVGFDSWVTIGDNYSPATNVATLGDLNWPSFAGSAWSFGGTPNSDASIFRIPTDAECLPDANGRVLLGQFTTDGVLSGYINLKGLDNSIPWEENNIPIPQIQTSITGCTDSLANNYNPLATIDDGSCNYSAPTITNVTITDPIDCNGGYGGITVEITSTSTTGLEVKVGYFASWNPTYFISQASSPVLVGYTTYQFPGLFAGTYIIRIVDTLSYYAANPGGSGTSLNGVLSYSVPVILDQPDSLLTNLFLTDVSCVSLTDGTATAVVSGGTLPYNIDWGSVNPNFLLAGNYNVLVTDINGCSSGIINYTINQSLPLVSYTNITTCDSVLIGSNYYTISGAYTDTLTSINGCDSIINSTLTIEHNTSSYDTLSVTASIVWNGMSLNVSGDYSVTLINSAGCDSIANLNLTVTTTGVLDITDDKRNLFKITDMLGQEVPYRRNTPLFYIYDDGTVEKRIVIE